MSHLNRDIQLSSIPVFSIFFKSSRCRQIALATYLVFSILFPLSLRMSALSAIGQYGDRFALHFEEASNTRVMAIGILAIGVAVCWIRRLKLSAMSKVPGPWYLKATTAFVKYHELRGTKRDWIHSLHLEHGPVVQIGRNEVSFASYTAAKQIYSSGNKEFRKTELYNLFEQDGHM